MGNESSDEFTIIWRIENFSLFFHEMHGSCLVSPECTAENLENNHFHLRLMSFHDKKSSFVISVYLYFHDRSIPIECTMDITDAFGKNLLSKTFAKSEVIIPYQGLRQYQWKNIMKFDEILNKMMNWIEDTLTVRCHIRSEIQTRQPKIECELRTTIGVDRCYFAWKMEIPNTSDWSESKNFCFHDQTPIHISLSAPEDDVLINIQNETKDWLFVTCRMSLVDINGYERYSQIGNNLFRDDNAVWKFPTFFTKTMLKDKKNSLYRHDLFTLTCNFSVPNGVDCRDIRYCTLPLVVDAVSSLQDDLHGMFTSKKHTDIKLRLDKEIFPAHKSHLAARSPVFSAMFDHDMLENRTGIVDIEDMDVKTLNSFLEFMYTGTVDDMDYENASKLLTVAEKYQVLSLKEKCASFLMSVLSEENVCEVTALSDIVGHKLLKASSIDYIKSHAGNILSSPQWSQWIGNEVQLATEILCMLSTNAASDK